MKWLLIGLTIGTLFWTGGSGISCIPTIGNCLNTTILQTDYNNLYYCYFGWYDAYMCIYKQGCLNETLYLFLNKICSRQCNPWLCSFKY